MQSCLFRREVEAGPADDGGQLELEVEQLAARRHGDGIPRPDDRVRADPEEARRLVPVGVNGRVRPAVLDRAGDMLLEGDEVADRRRVERRAQPDVCERDPGSGRPCRGLALDRRRPEQLDHARARQRQNHVGLDDPDLLLSLVLERSDLHQIGAAVTSIDLIVSPTKSASWSLSCSHRPIWRDVSQMNSQRS
jgi:hypothetical protein